MTDEPAHAVGRPGYAGRTLGSTGPTPGDHDVERQPLLGGPLRMMPAVSTLCPFMCRAAVLGPCSWRAARTTSWAAGSSAWVSASNGRRRRSTEPLSTEMRRRAGAELVHARACPVRARSISRLGGPTRWLTNHPRGEEPVVTTVQTPETTGTTHQTAQTQFARTTDGVRFAYRRFGAPIGVPLLFLQHFRGDLDSWDPAVVDAIAAEREVILMDNRGVGALRRPGAQPRLRHGSRRPRLRRRPRARPGGSPWGSRSAGSSLRRSPSSGRRRASPRPDGHRPEGRTSHARVASRHR